MMIDNRSILEIPYLIFLVQCKKNSPRRLSAGELFLCFLECWISANQRLGINQSYSSLLFSDLFLNDIGFEPQTTFFLSLKSI